MTTTELAHRRSRLRPYLIAGGAGADAALGVLRRGVRRAGRRRPHPRRRRARRPLRARHRRQRPLRRRRLPRVRHQRSGSRGGRGAPPRGRRCRRHRRPRRGGRIHRAPAGGRSLLRLAVGHHPRPVRPAVADRPARRRRRRRAPRWRTTATPTRRSTSATGRPPTRRPAPRSRPPTPARRASATSPSAPPSRSGPRPSSAPCSAGTPVRRARASTSRTSSRPAASTARRPSPASPIFLRVDDAAALAQRVRGARRHGPVRGDLPVRRERRLPRRPGRAVHPVAAGPRLLKERTVDYADQTSTFRFDDSILHLGPTSSTVVRDFTWDQIGEYAAHFAR